MKTRVDLKLGDKTYRLVPSPRALMRIAKEVGDPAQMMVSLSVARELGKPPPLASVVDVLHIALEESEHEIDKADLWKLIFDHGAMEANLFEDFAAFIGALVNRGVVPEVEEPDPEADDVETGNRRERRAKKAKARARTGKARS